MNERSEANRPIMDLVGGPQGSGKSSFFPVNQGGYESFNIDEVRKRLNGGSAQNIPPDVQRAATSEYEQFIEGHIRTAKSFSIEVTLAKEVTFEQARKARAAGFSVHLTYVAAELKECTRRMAARVESGEHGVRVGVLRATHAASLGNLNRAIREFDHVQVFDNSRRLRLDDPSEGRAPGLVLEAHEGAIVYKARRLPPWLKRALKARKSPQGKRRG